MLVFATFSWPLKIAITFHQDCCRYLVIAQTTDVWGKIKACNLETKKGRAITFLSGKPSWPHTHCYQVSSIRISYGYLVMVFKDRLKKPKGCYLERESSHFYICLLSWPHAHGSKVYQDILYVAHKDILKHNNQKDAIQTRRKGDQTFHYRTCLLNLIHIALKFHQDIT